MLHFCVMFIQDRIKFPVLTVQIRMTEGQISYSLRHHITDTCMHIQSFLFKLQHQEACVHCLGLSEHLSASYFNQPMEY